MNAGMLWFDNDPRTDLITKLAQAADYFKRKYGYQPDVCFIHPTLASKMTDMPAGLAVKASQMIRPNYFWLGIHEPTQG